MRQPKGLTLMELVITAAISVFVIFGAAVLVAESLKSLRIMYTRLHSEAAENSYAVRITFDRMIRRASFAYPVIMLPSPRQANTIAVYYYERKNSPYADRRAELKYDAANKKLILTYYSVDSYGKPTGKISEQTINDVSSTSGYPFRISGYSMQMLLTIENKSNNPAEPFSETINVVSSAHINNG